MNPTRNYLVGLRLGAGDSFFWINTQVGRQKCFICQDFKHKSNECPKKKGKPVNGNEVKTINIQNKVDFPLLTENEDAATDGNEMEVADQANETSQASGKSHESSPKIESRAKKPRINSPFKGQSEWKFEDWSHVRQGNLNPTKNKVLHSFPCTLPKSDLHNADITMHLPELMEHKTILCSLLEELMTVLRSPQVELKRDLRIIINKIKPHLSNDTHNSN